MDYPVLEIKNISKSYGRIRALDNFSLIVHSGEICGILGPNGSGKTTTLGLILDVLKPDSGGYLWFGEKPTHLTRRRVGALLEQPMFYPYLSAMNNLRIIADIKGVSYNGIDGVLETVGLTSRKTSKYRTYSMGMRQRLAIAAALLGEPEVLILDEPTNGLDPKGIADIRDLIIDIGKQGVTVLLASHLLDEVQKICSHVVILQKGKKLNEGNVKEVLSASAAYELAAADMPELRKILENLGYFSEIKEENGKWLCTLSQEIDPGRLNRLIADQGIYLTHLSRRKKSLEKYFLDSLNAANG
ncbi:MAG: ATP-binding cassette domain-containing protein [Chlorobi bacterium]|nr:ATP-binding cassette domain-containing protein [Chlorobiota bacterium]